MLTALDARRRSPRDRDWRTDYNDVRPHSSLDQMPPAEFAAAHRGTAGDLHISTQSTARLLLRFSTRAFLHPEWINIGEQVVSK